MLQESSDGDALFRTERTPEGRNLNGETPDHHTRAKPTTQQGERDRRAFEEQKQPERERKKAGERRGTRDMKDEANGRMHGTRFWRIVERVNR